MPRRSAGRLRRRSAATRLRVKVGHPDDSTGSATIHSHIIVMATVSRGVKPYSGQPQGVIRDSLHAPGSTVAHPRHLSPLPRDKPAAQAPTDAALETQRTRRSKQHTPRYHIGTHHGQGWLRHGQPKDGGQGVHALAAYTTGFKHLAAFGSSHKALLKYSSHVIVPGPSDSSPIDAFSPHAPCRPRSSEYVFFRDGARV
jgi:hypothetical protein